MVWPPYKSSSREMLNALCAPKKKSVINEEQKSWMAAYFRFRIYNYKNFPIPQDATFETIGHLFLCLDYLAIFAKWREAATSFTDGLEEVQHSAGACNLRFA